MNFTPAKDDLPIHIVGGDFDCRVVEGEGNPRCVIIKHRMGETTWETKHFPKFNTKTGRNECHFDKHNREIKIEK